MTNLLEQPYSLGEVDKASHQINVETLKALVHQDPKVHGEEKTSLLSFLNQPNALSILLAGASGAAIATTIAKYEKLDATSRALLGLAGFGIGAILVKHIGSDQTHLVDYQAGRGYRVNQ